MWQGRLEAFKYELPQECTLKFIDKTFINNPKTKKDSRLYMLNGRKHYFSVVVENLKRGKGVSTTQYMVMIILGQWLNMLNAKFLVKVNKCCANWELAELNIQISLHEINSKCRCQSLSNIYTIQCLNITNAHTAQSLICTLSTSTLSHVLYKKVLHKLKRLKSQKNRKCRPNTQYNNAWRKTVIKRKLHSGG